MAENETKETPKKNTAKPEEQAGDKQAAPKKEAGTKSQAKDKSGTQKADADKSGGKAQGKPKAGEKTKTPAARKAQPAPKGEGPRLKKIYREQVIKALSKERGYRNVLEVPQLKKIILNIGLGNAREDSNALKGALDDLAVITGQKAVVTYAKKPISNFKIREKDPVGVKVTLRKDRMWEFFDRLMSLTIPRVRDFRGLPIRSFDGRGNYSFGLTEQIVFPEIDYDKIDQIRGMDVTLVTTAKTDEEAYELLKAFGFPFRARPQAQTEGAAA